MTSGTVVSRAENSLVSWARQNWELVGLLLLCGAVYQPWNSPYLPLTDFGIFLVERGTSHSLLSQYAGIAGYYVGEGRLLLIQFVQLTLGSAIFGLSAPGWHWMFFAIMSSVLLLGRKLLLETGVSRAAAIAALALFATMGPVAEGWIAPMGEPLALLFFIIALRAAVNYSTASDWRNRAYLIAACALGIVFSKELLVVLLPAGWLLSRLEIRNREWKWAPWTQRDTFLLLLVGGVVVVFGLIPVAVVVERARSASYASQYRDAVPWKLTLERLEAVLVPAAPRLRRLVNVAADPGWTLLLTLPSLLWIRLIVGGIAEGKKKIWWPLVVALVWVSLGVLAYLPWPTRAGYYMLPFALGTMFLAAHGLTSLLERSKAATRGALAVVALLVASTSLEARTILYQHQQRAQLNAEVIDAVGHLGATRLVAATPRPTQGRGGWAPHLKGFGSVSNGLHLTEARDMTCADARKALTASTGIAIVSAASGCGEMTPDAIVVKSVVPVWQWPILWRKGAIEGRMYVSRGRTEAVTALR
jgi:hypothetical protein